MIIRRLSSLIILPAILATACGQYYQFDLDELTGPGFGARSTTVVKNSGLALGHHPLYSVNSAARLRLGLAAGNPFDFKNDIDNGWLPTVELGFLVTTNMVLTGKIGGFKSGNDIVQVTSYGATLFLENAPQQEPWVGAAGFTVLRGPRDLWIRLTDILLHRQYLVWRLPVTLGIGTNLTTARLTLDSDTTYNRCYTGQTNYLYLGWQKKLKPGNCGMHLRLHSEIAVLTFDFMREFE